MIRHNKDTSPEFKQFIPHRCASWWSVAEDLLWPEKKVRDKIQRRADALAAAHVDTVIQFGFHCRFDFAWYFGAMHGYFAEIAGALHERGIRFLDHFSCNVVARPNSATERISYHSFQRHHVDLYPDAVAAETAGYAGYRFNDLREIDLVTGKPAYTNIYQAELFCHNNPDFQAMHETYLQRLFAEVPFDGLQQDDMAFYNYFRSCGCRFCRERFSREYGHELPPLEDRSFWGDINEPPSQWGNYANPAFRDWVQMRYRIITGHLAMVKCVIGPNRPLLTCCSNSGPQGLNSLALSYERFIEVCDWVMLENCGLGCGSVKWQEMESEAVLHKSIGLSKGTEPAQPVACSYAVYEDSAYLGWAISRFWGVVNWISTLRHNGEDNPNNAEEAELIAPFNMWDIEHDTGDPGEDVVEVAVAFFGANKENGFCGEDGREYWQRCRDWSLALLKHNIGYRFVTGRESHNLSRMADCQIPLILDSCACIADAELEGIEAFLARGGRIWVVPPFGTHDERGRIVSRKLPQDVCRLPVADPADLLGGLLCENAFSPRITVSDGNRDWKIRLRKTPDGLTIHLLNQALKGVPHPTELDRWMKNQVLASIRSTASREPVVFEVDISGLATEPLETLTLNSPEWPSPRTVELQCLRDHRYRLTLDLSDVRLYAMTKLNIK